MSESTAAPDPAGTGQPVTMAITRHVKADRVADYDAWLHQVTILAARWPGYQGITVVRPHGGPHPEYTSIVRFDTEANLTRWLDAPERQEMLARAADLAEDPATEVITEPGVEFWFTPHGDPAPARPPARWKMTIILTALIFLMAQITREVFMPLAPYAPPRLVQLLSIGLQVFALSYFLLPWLTKRLAFWLKPKAAS